jgi:hypothetical protein
MKRLLLSFLLIAFTGFVFAENVDLAQATKVAKNAYFQKLNKFQEQTSFDALTITETFTISENGEAVYYVFNFDNFGYIMISAEDNWKPVLGYSFEGQYSQENQPENFAGWMESRAGNINFIRENKIEATPEINQAWNELIQLNTANPIAKDGSKSVDMLLTSTWNQDSPYNYYCPLDDQGPGGRVYVGCVATAMIQIMYYYRYPYVGIGEHSWWAQGYGWQIANFGESYYDWDAMVDNSDQDVNLEIAEIGYHAGIAVDMQYGWDGSGAFSQDVPYAMKTYFGYSNTCQHLSKTNNISWNDWKSWIQEELDEACPIYYAGVNSSGGGHAFVLDGYQTGDNTFHFNFGWSGQGNGWFDIEDSSGYEWYSDQRMIRNFFPDPANYPYGTTSGNENNNLVGSMEDGSGPIENYDADASGDWLISPQNEQDSVTSIKLQFVFLETDVNDVVTIYDGNSASAPVIGTYSGTTPTEIIQSTGNEMFITFEANGDGNTGAGWKVEFESVRPSWCSGMTVYTETNGTINDGSGDFYYKEKTNCMWQITPQWASDVTLTFTEFNTEENEDVVKIYDATNNQLLAELSGDYTGDMPDPIYCENAELFITWQTSNAMNYPGWTADWTIGNTSIEEDNENFSNLNVYPNPTESNLKISFNLDQKQSFETKLISVTGEVVYSETANDFLGNYSNTIDVSKLAKGVYFLNLTSDTESVNKKVVVK